MEPARFDSSRATPSEHPRASSPNLASESIIPIFATKIPILLALVGLAVLGAVLLFREETNTLYEAALASGSALAAVMGFGFITFTLTRAMRQRADALVLLCDLQDATRRADARNSRARERLQSFEGRRESGYGTDDELKPSERARKEIVSMAKAARYGEEELLRNADVVVSSLIEFGWGATAVEVRAARLHLSDSVEVGMSFEHA